MMVGGMAFTVLADDVRGASKIFADDIRGKASKRILDNARRRRLFESDFFHDVRMEVSTFLR